MGKQFFYTRKERVPNPVEKDETSSSSSEVTYSEKVYIDSFNVDLIIRSKELPTGQVIVLLNDLHEQYDNVPMISNSGKVTGMRKEKATYQSEIIIEPEDTERFRKATEV